MTRDLTKTGVTLAPHQVILRPLVTEKGMHKATRNNAYSFEVNRLAGKDEIRHAIEELFEVKVESVKHAKPQGQAAPPGEFRRAPPKAGKKRS